MFFVRKYTSGAGDYDPRQRRWAEFHCALCGHDEDYDITRTELTFQYDRERRCPACGQLNADDREKNLKAQLAKLTNDKSKIEVEIEKLMRELDEISQTSSHTGTQQENSDGMQRSGLSSS
ncbi:MAG: hypothetical protein GF334_01035 [Candidatus Altiarchaeales archaeon]|nr:hypothetical protein [Candidatus Altiarchaeales archaeon]